MKSVTFSDIERVEAHARFLPIIRSAQRQMTLALTLGLGLPALMLALHVIDPTAPLAYIVVPVLLGGIVPLARSLPGRLEVSTRFSACHLVGTLDDALDKLGYVSTDRGPGAVRYRVRTARWPQWQSNDIAVTVHEHALEVTGPVQTLRALRRQMAC